MATEIQTRLTTAYSGTTSTRRYTITGVSAAIVDSIGANVKAFNESISGGTSGGVENVLISDEGTPMTGIVEATTTITETTPIFGEVTFDVDNGNGNVDD